MFTTITASARRGGRLLVQLVVRLVLRSPSPSLVFATIAAVPRPRGFPYILACFHVQRHCQKAYSDCSIVAARTRFLSSHTVSSPNQLDRAARAWCVALKYAPRPGGEGEGTRAPRAARAWLVMCEEEALQVEPTGRGRQRVRCPRSVQSRIDSQCLRCSRPRARQRCRASRLRIGRWPRPRRRSCRVRTRPRPHLTPPTRSSQASGIPRLERA